jgi:mono/diheme cytochrome c family protein
MKTKSIPTWSLAMLGLLGSMLAVAGPTADKKMLERGRYLLATSGCNDCHTPGYPESGGNIPEAKWLLGSPVGFQGPWGTSYPANLRLLMSELTEQRWLQKARTPTRPPMPWFSLREMTDADLRAIYAYVRKLGLAGVAAPAYANPGQVVQTPYFEFVPKNLPVTAQAGH